MAAVAVANLTAARQERRSAAATSDVATATVEVTADAATLRPGSVVLTVSISNTGPVLQLRSPRVESAGYALEPVGPIPPQVRSGQTVLLTVRLHGACRAEAEVPPRLVARVVPPSGRLHEVTAGISPDLGALLCGRDPDSASVAPQVSGVSSTRYAVAFVLGLRNLATAEVVLESLGAEGLAFGVRGGVPVRLPAGTTTSLVVRLAIPACGQLPGPLDTQRVDTLPFGAFELQLTDASGRRTALPYVPVNGSELQRAIHDLAHRTCPRVVL